MSGRIYAMKRAIATVFCFSAFLLTGIPREAKAVSIDYTVTGCDIASGINAVNTGAYSRILIPAGTCTLVTQLPVITRPVTIQGSGGQVTINAGSTDGPVLRIYPDAAFTTTLLNLTITNGKNQSNPAATGVASALGGGIVWDGDGGNLIIDNCTVSGNSTDKGNGGGIAAYDSTASGTSKLTISNSTISSNTATDGSGGGIFVGQKVDLIMSGSTISGNKAGATGSNFGQGGGLFLFGPAGSTGSSISSSSFTNNSAVDDGGAIYTTAPITFSSVTYDKNSVGVDGNGPDVWNNINGTQQLTAAVNAAPVVTAGGTVTFTEHNLPKTAAPGLTISDSDNANLTGATVTISTGAVSGDTLAFPTLAEIDGTETALINGSISSTYNSSTYTLTLTGTATKEKYQAALKTVTYANNRHDLPDGSRTVSYTVTDGVETSTPVTSSVSFVAVNDAPVLSITPRALTTITEKDTANPGQSVSSIIGNTVATNLITDLDYNPTNDPAAGLRGIAVVGQNVNGVGKWQFSTDGMTWSDFGSVNNATARLLRSTDAVRFLPDGWNSASASFTYRAWDQSSGTAGTIADTGTNGGETAFSLTTATASITVTAVNDAPGLSSDASLAAVLQGVANPPGETVANLFGAKFQDFDSGASLGGLVVIANDASAATQGRWQYSTDSGTNWYDVASATNAAALFLSSSTKIRFLPVAAFYGSPDSLAVRAVDNSYAGSWTNGATRVTANVSTNGGTTPYAAVARALTTSITPVADLTVSKSHSGSFMQGQSGATYSITVTNRGAGSTSGTVSLTDTLPSGLTATGITGSGWSCTLATLTCSRSDVLASAGSYPQVIVTVAVANNAPASVTNVVDVSGGGEIITDNDSASDLTLVATSKINAIVIDPAASTRIYAAVDGEGVYRSTDGGASWLPPSGNTNTRVKGLVMQPSVSTTLFAATYGGGAIISTDSGVNWSACTNNGLTGSSLNATCLTTDTTGTLYIGSESGIYTSTDCNTWSAVNSGLTVDAAKPPVALAIHGSTLYAGLDGGGLFKKVGSSDWTAASGLPAESRVKAIVVKDAENLYAAVYDAGVYKSSDSGANWSACGTAGLTSLDLYSLEIDGNGYLYAGTEAGVFSSSNGCSSWTDMNSGLP